MKRTVAKVTHQGTYRVIYDDSKLYEKYTVYRENYSEGWHSKKIDSFSSLAGCLYFLGNEIIEGESA